MKKDANECELCKTYYKPNAETRRAIYEAHNNINLTEIDDLEEFINEIMKD